MPNRLWSVYSDTKYSLGNMYAMGQGVPQDSVEAVRWWRLAAEQGQVDAQFLIGSMYYGVPQDYPEAARWFHLAAAQGHGEAQGILGTMYFMAQGVPRDFVEAYMWASLAASHLSGAAREQTVTLLDEMVTVMTPAEINEAQGRARNWARRR